MLWFSCLCTRGRQTNTLSLLWCYSPNWPNLEVCCSERYLYKNWIFVSYCHFWTYLFHKKKVCLFVLWGEGSEKDGLSWWSTLQMFSETYQQHKVEYPRGLHNLIETKCSKCIYVPLKSSDSSLDAARRFVNKELCFWFPFKCKRITWYTLGVSRLSKS